MRVIFDARKPPVRAWQFGKSGGLQLDLGGPLPGG